MATGRPCCGGFAPPSVTVLGTKIVKPPPYTSAIESLSPLDHINTPFLIIHLPFVFGTKLDFGLATEALSLTLARLPLFAGRLVIDPSSKNYGIDASAPGASLITANSKATLNDLLPFESAAGGLISAPRLGIFGPKVPTTISGYCDRPKVPLLSVQITHLAGGGSVLVMSIPHLIADQATCRTFLCTWAEAYSDAAAAASNGKIDFDQDIKAKVAMAAKLNLATPAFAARAAPSIPAGYAPARFERRSWKFFPSIIASIASLAAKGGVATVCYHVPESRLAALKAQGSAALDASRTINPESNLPAFISTNDALAARVHQAIRQALPQKTSAALELVVDLRGRLDPPLGPVLGNCSWSVPVELNGSGPSALLVQGAEAAAVRSAIEALDVDVVVKELRWVEDNGARGGKKFPVVLTGLKALLSEAGPVLYSKWEWEVGYADMSFGVGGAPVWHQPWDMKNPNTVFVTPVGAGRAGGGVLVFVTLHKKLAAQLKCKVSAL